MRVIKYILVFIVGTLFSISVLSNVMIIVHGQTSPIEMTSEQIEKYCFEQRKLNGHAGCDLPTGVVVKLTAEEKVVKLQSEFDALNKRVEALENKLK